MMEHAVTPAARKLIRTKLQGMAERHDIEILLAAENGSRAFGYASAASDYDVRFIYRRKEMRSYIRVDPLSDTIQSKQPFEAPGEIPTDLDLSGWDILKAASLLRSSNPSLIEWVMSPIHYEEGYVEEIAGCIPDVFSIKAVAFHYWSMAHNQMKNYILGRESVVVKKYIYAIRPYLAVLYLMHYGCLPMANVFSLLEALRAHLSYEVYVEILRILSDRCQGIETGEAPANACLNAWMEAAMIQTHAWATNLETRKVDADIVNALVWRILLPTPKNDVADFEAARMERTLHA